MIWVQELHGRYCSIVVSTSDCGSENPGSIPGSGNFLNIISHDNNFHWHNQSNKNKYINVYTKQILNLSDLFDFSSSAKATS